MKISGVIILFLGIFFSCDILSQLNENGISYFRNDSVLVKPVEFCDSLIDAFPVNNSSENEVILKGQLISIFHEYIEDAIIEISVEDKKYVTRSADHGLFGIALPEKVKGEKLVTHIYHNDYRDLDTLVLINKEFSQDNLIISLLPKYNILVRGRVFAGSSPLEGINVTVKRNDIPVDTLITPGCFYDNDNYWNCLYNGMFISSVSTENITDSVHILLSGKGFKSLRHSFMFSEYTGNLLKLKMRYAPVIPDLSRHNLSLRLSFPFLTKDNWFIDLSYYYRIPFKNFNRLAAGGDISLIFAAHTSQYSTLPGADEASVDSIYLNAFAGPSVIFWITSPDRRYFSTYTGISAGLSLLNRGVSIQPFVGSRVFLDMNKSLFFEARYLSYEMKVKEYIFSEFGNAVDYDIQVRKSDILLNFGIQVNF